ncbi:hypothetical protein SA496_21365 [Pseudomonas sp. JS3066]|uniref:hypothetical protein n=1 Tax=Pseudomonas sp. JS3066 TaxID=3090665 RepID=UPI002E7B340D|nr:hypothetical protein [Pseudomonas sp. JS3066]WVK92251.1 hypothetical protein SA496_21365 [Pseudomonas sp. JS3066]
MLKEKLSALMGKEDGQSVTSVGKALGAKTAIVAVVAAASAVPMMANAAITVPPEMLDVFTDLATAFGVIMAAGAVLFGVIRGGVALFKLAGRIFSAAGA